MPSWFFEGGIQDWVFDDHLFHTRWFPFTNLNGKRRPRNPPAARRPSVLYRTSPQVFLGIAVKFFYQSKNCGRRIILRRIGRVIFPHQPAPIPDCLRLARAAASYSHVVGSFAIHLIDRLQLAQVWNRAISTTQIVFLQRRVIITNFILRQRIQLAG